VRPRVAAYAALQLRDFLVGRAPLLFLATGLTVWALLRVNGVTLAAFDAAAGVGGRDAAWRAFADALGAYAVLGAVFTAQSLVARDRWRGFDRLLFSRPLNPVRYYIQAFVMAGVAVVGLAVLAAGLFSVVAYPVSVPGVAAYVALTWFSLGTFAFALTTVTTYHLPIVIGVLGGALLVDRFERALGEPNTLAGVIDATQYLLPPAHVIVALREPFARGLFVGPPVLAWPLAFGALCLTLAALVLSRRPFRS